MIRTKCVLPLRGREGDSNAAISWPAKYGEQYKQIWTGKSGQQCPGQSVHNVLLEGMHKLMKM